MAEQEPADVFSGVAQVDTRLQSMNLSRDRLLDALRQGELQRRLATPLDPPTTAGFTAWSRTVRALRENLGPAGWTPSDNGISTVVSPDKSVAIAVATGSDGTGDAAAIGPRTKNPRGSATVAAVRTNQQLELFETLPGESNGELSSASGVQKTWFLMFRSTPDGVISELSCPKAVGPTGRVDEWSERIILGLDGGEDAGAAKSESPSGGAPSEPDINIVRRN